MGKVSYHFFTCLFNAVLVYIILINFTGWSGAFVDIVGQSNTNNWQNSYFGFQSLQTMLSTCNTFFNNEQMSFTKLLEDLNNLAYVITFGLPNLFQKLVTDSIQIVDLIKVVITLLLQPLLLAFYILKIIAYILVYVTFFITLLMRAFSGEFNIPFDNIPDYHPSSLVIPPVLASGFML